MTKATKFNDVVSKAQATIERFVSFNDKSQAFVCALYCVLSHFWTHFDSLPYMVITAATKRAGKSTLMETMEHISANPLPCTGITPSTLFRMIEESHPTLFIDEAETLSSEAAGSLREALNAGYRRGKKIPRTVGNEVKMFDLYGLKVFCLIGDVNDTLRDRSIVITLVRAAAPMRSTYTDRELAGNELRAIIAETANDSAVVSAVLDAYANFKGAPYLTDREEEIWTPLFVLCQVFCPERMVELQRAAVDLGYSKTAEARKYTEDFFKSAEQTADAKYFGEILIRDIHTVIGKRSGVPSAELLPALKDLTTSPWRTYKGRGLTYDDIGALLAVVIERNPNGAATASTATFRLAGKVVRGYSKKYIEEAAKRCNIAL